MKMDWDILFVLFFYLKKDLTNFTYPRLCYQPKFFMDLNNSLQFNITYNLSYLVLENGDYNIKFHKTKDIKEVDIHLPKMKKKREKKILVYVISITILRGIEWIWWPTLRIFHFLFSLLCMTRWDLVTVMYEGLRFEGAYQKYLWLMRMRQQNVIKKEGIVSIVWWNVS